MKASFPFVQGNFPASLLPLESEYGRQSARPVGSLEPGFKVGIAKAGLRTMGKEQINLRE